MMTFVETPIFVEDTNRSVDINPGYGRIDGIELSVNRGKMVWL